MESNQDQKMLSPNEILSLNDDQLEAVIKND
jgi:hypothetical protein